MTEDALRAALAARTVERDQARRRADGLQLQVNAWFARAELAEAQVAAVRALVADGSTAVDFRATAAGAPVWTVTVGQIEAALAVGDGTPARGCCSACSGLGGTSSGTCWDCRGTGCAHPPPLCAVGDGTPAEPPRYDLPFVNDVDLDLTFEDDTPPSTGAADEPPDASTDLLEALVDRDDCWFDHNGGCQAHGYLSLQLGDICPQAELKTVLAARGVVPSEDPAPGAGA